MSGRKVNHEYGPAAFGGQTVSCTATEQPLATLACAPKLDPEQTLDDEW